MDLKQAFQTALDFEQKGHKIYEEISKKTENPIVARTFKYLAEQELVHIEEINGYMGEKKVELKGDKLDDTKKFFSMTVEDFKMKTKLSDDDIEAHRTALELEKKSYEFYGKQKEQTDEPELKEFFKFLMEQENTHYQLIQNAYEYIRNPEHFFAEEEKWIVEG